MFSHQEIKHRAVMMGIKTGDMPDVDFIWTIQQSEGSEMCFGHGLGCQNRNCHWRAQCLALDFYEDTKLPIAPENAPAKSIPQEQQVSRVRQPQVKYTNSTATARNLSPSPTATRTS